MIENKKNKQLVKKINLNLKLLKDCTSNIGPIRVAIKNIEKICIELLKSEKEEEKISTNLHPSLFQVPLLTREFAIDLEKFLNLQSCHRYPLMRVWIRNIKEYVSTLIDFYRYLSEHKDPQMKNKRKQIEKILQYEGWL